MEPQVKYIPLDSIVLQQNVRSVAETDPDIQELAASMERDGQEIEVRVYPAPNHAYFLKAGYRRVMAAKLLGWLTIRAIVEAAPENEINLLIAQVNENDFRRALSYLDRARVFARLKELGENQKAIAERFGTSEADVSLSLSMLRATPKLQQAVQEGKIEPSAARALLSQSPEVQDTLLDAAVRAKTARKITALVKAHERGVDFQSQVVNELPEAFEDIDPLEEMALNELSVALEHLKLAVDTPILHPTLNERARLIVQELLALTWQVEEELNVPGHWENQLLEARVQENLRQ